MENLTDCTPVTTTRQICHDEVLIAITSDSNTLRSALSFSAGTTYYLISEKQGGRRGRERGREGEGERERERERGREGEGERERERERERDRQTDRHADTERQAASVY